MLKCLNELEEPSAPICSVPNASPGSCSAPLVRGRPAWGASEGGAPGLLPVPLPVRAVAPQCPVGAVPVAPHCLSGRFQWLPGLCRAGAGGAVPLSAVPGAGGAVPLSAVPGAGGAVPGAGGAVPLSAVPGAGGAVPGAGGSRCRWFPVPAGRWRWRCRRFPVPAVPGAGGAVSQGRCPGAGPAEAACPVPPAPLAAAVTCRPGGGGAAAPPSLHPPSLPPSLLPRPGWRWERPRSHHEHPQGLQHVGDRLPGDQIPTERGNPNPGRQEHQVRAGGYLAGQRSPGGDEGQGRQPQSHPTPDRQRGPVLRGLRALRGSCGAKHSAGVPEVGLSPASPPSLDSTCIPERPHLRPPSPAGCQRCPGTTTCIPAQGKTTTKTPHCSCLRLPPA